MPTLKMVCTTTSYSLLAAVCVCYWRKKQIGLAYRNSKGLSVRHNLMHVQR